MIPLEFCENRLLSSLPADDTALLQSHLRVAFLHSGATLFQAGHAVQLAYFPLRGAIALTTILSAGQMIETALVGRNGNIGGYAALARQPATCNAIVRINGEALTIEAGRLRQLAAERPAIAAMLYREHSASLAESQHSAACARLTPCRRGSAAGSCGPGTSRERHRLRSRKSAWRTCSECVGQASV